MNHVCHKGVPFLLGVAVFSNMFVAKGDDLRTNQLLIGGEKVESKIVDGKMVGDKWLATSNGFGQLHVEVTPLQGPVAVPGTNAFSNGYQPRLQVMLGEGHGVSKSGGVKGMSGLMYMARDWKKPDLAQTNHVEILSTEDNENIVVMVQDNGPIYSSTNSGMTWTVINTPGKYDFPLTSQPDGAGFYGETTLYPSPDNQKTGAATPTNWYALGSGPDGISLVLSADASQPSPALSITYANGGMVISWPSALAGFALQVNRDFTTSNWVQVTNAVNKVGEENQVLVSSPAPNNFYRLKSNARAGGNGQAK
jgi:hypothetical protein